jgi:hypothetical protein
MAAMEFDEVYEEIRGVLVSVSCLLRYLIIGSFSL